MGYENTAGLGVLNHYGPRTTDEKFGGVNGRGKVKTVVTKFSYNDLPTPGADNAIISAYVPTGAQVINAYIKATTTFVGGTSYDIGLQESDGTEIDNDGLFDALTLAEANAGAMAADNTFVQQGLELAADGYVVVAATGTFTAGAAELVIEYTL